MAIFDPQPGDDELGEAGYLEFYRSTVERLQRETAHEFGGQPMPPEAFSMIAVLLASLPLMALLHPGIPVDLREWQVGLTMVGVWAVAFFVQRLRYDRFQAKVRHKLARISDEAGAGVRGRSPTPNRQRGRSAQTSGAAAAR